MKTPVHLAHIYATGEYVPAQVLSNEHFAAQTGKPVDWFVRRTGILERRRAGEQESSASMAIAAVRNLLQDIGQWPAPVDLVISASYTPHDTIGTTAHQVQRAFTLRNAKVFELSSACSSFLNALEVAATFIEAERSRCALIVATEHNSHFSDADSNHLWGDGAAAVLLAPGGNLRVLNTLTRGRAELGRGPEAVRMQPRAGGLQMPHGREVFHHAVAEMEQIGREILASAGLTQADISLVVPHQANLRILQALAERLGIDASRVAVSIDRLGNTGSASIPITLHRNEARVPPGGKVLMLSFGGGYSVGAALLQRL
ncbi:MAG: ketoacyl-ACP synthase III [Proteobacteria bacterium]|nr:ketoacyl-ACP synthase III [Pseudomonadota bacterium]